ncbi:hypothetical protein SAMN04487905_101161 [Actinopolyspora xinjiangensis]|uniref:Uncharacterized protein n=1 Tax=Actinopolyspora xinjiangensis TaxID=405564 RepID=A0A1H0NK82_9ACTN|nr:hypothetical protein SAMN04487905_101161 [Actinopolyspora xinjiangensis]
MVLAATEADYYYGQSPRMHAIEHHPSEYTASWVLSLCHMRLGLGEMLGITAPEVDPELCAPCCSTIAVSSFRGRVVRHAHQ